MADDPPATVRAIDAARYRQVLGQYPTGVCVVTSKGVGGEICAMVVGSFSSVSLDPPLVGFFPDRKSSSWAKLRLCERFSINVLGADQEGICRKLASKDPDKFAGIPHHLSARGNPILDGSVAWLDCDLHSITDAGDHEMVMGRIIDLDLSSGTLPLLFFRGGYGRFAPGSLVADQAQGISLAQLRTVDRVRPDIERLTSSIGAQCIVTVRVGGALAVAATAGQGRQDGGATLVGQRLPLVYPTGSVFAAWFSAEEQGRWLARYAGDRAAAVSTLQRVRERGYSIGLLNPAQQALSERLRTQSNSSQHAIEIDDLLEGLSYDPADLTPEVLRAVRVISAPVLGIHGDVTLALTLYDYRKPSGSDVTGYVTELVEAAHRLSWHAD